MKFTHLIQNPNSSASATVQARIYASCQDKQYDELRIAMAYVTVAGIRKLLDAFSENQIKVSQWLVGIDDCVTQPGAIELIQGMPHAELLIASCSAFGSRFHPKVCFVRRGKKRDSGFMMIGSANLTQTALAGNAEAVAFFYSGNPSETDGLTIVWDQLWRLGHIPSKGELQDYKKKYIRARSLRAKIERISKARSQKPKSSLVFDTDHAELDPSLASACWIECGFTTLFGRELEFKAEQGLFFGLAPRGGNPHDLEFKLSNGSIVSLRMKYQGNHMWRLQMNPSVPEVAVGLRPRKRDGILGRSPYVAVFRRTPVENRFQLRFIRLDSTAYKRLLVPRRL